MARNLQIKIASDLEPATATSSRVSEVRFVARGNDMLPSIVLRDRLTIKSLSVGEVPACGEVLFVRRDGQSRVHRRLRVSNDSCEQIYVLRGDALLHEDPPVSRSQILGDITAMQRSNKSLPFNNMNTFYRRLLRFFPRHSSTTARQFGDAMIIKNFVCRACCYSLENTNLRPSHSCDRLYKRPQTDLKSLICPKRGFRYGFL